ncbi:hypothetical protein [Cellulomonas chitinilytica]|uniref:hypothetical protein n=1 Tax=Cellulomonas chitinilytica TaxID=398759 RepID=UPI001944341B|nr:hypothetical protein [Cellulomonas chitinilytica]
MPLFSRRRRLPAAERARLDLLPGDSVLASTELVDGQWVVASRRALHVLGAAEVARSPWCDVDGGTLDPTTRTLTVRWVWGSTSRLVFPEEPGARTFSQAFRERVQQSVVHVVTAVVPDGRRVKVALRRDEDGELFTQVIPDGAVDLTDPAVTTAVDAAEAEIRDAVGLPR